ncbi:MAG: hypothetical protein WAK12_10380 [Acidimicrobiales bacterium]
MNPRELSEVTADPIQVLGMSFYFDPLTKEQGREHGLNSVEFYGLGRGGVLGDVDTKTVFDAFTFFDPSTIDFLWTNAKVKADPVVVAGAHLQAAYAFADRTFGAIDPALLAAFAAAARKVVNAEPDGICPLVDGYKRHPAPKDPVHAAYLGTILLRELRGGVHILAVSEAGLDPVEACYLQDPAVFKWHGFKEEDAPEVTEDLAAKKRRAEELTSDAVASCFDVLSDVERDALAEGTKLMFEALANPVPVAR